MRLGSTLICRFVRSTSSHHRPWQIALAVAAGALLGLLPKSSMLVVVASFLCYLIPAHLPILVLTAVSISLAGPLLETTMGQIGLWSLTHPNLTGFWNRLDSFPLIPWLGIHNTVVNGSCVVWLVASIPIYVCALMVSRLFIDVSIPDAVVEVLLTADEPRAERSSEQEHVIRPIAGLRDPSIDRMPIEPPVVIWDDINHDPMFVDSEYDRNWALKSRNR